MRFFRALLLGAATIVAAALPPPFMLRIARNDRKDPELTNKISVLQTSRKINEAGSNLERRRPCTCRNRASAQARRASEAKENYENFTENIVKQSHNKTNNTDAMETFAMSNELNKTKDEAIIDRVEMKDTASDGSTTTVKKSSQTGMSGKVVTQKENTESVVEERNERTASDEQLLVDDADAAGKSTDETRALAFEERRRSLNAVAWSEKENAKETVTSSDELKQLKNQTIKENDIALFATANPEITIEAEKTVGELSDHDGTNKNFTSNTNRTSFSEVDSREFSKAGTRSEVQLVTETVTTNSHTQGNAETTKEESLMTTNTPKVETRTFSEISQQDEVQDLSTVAEKLVQDSISAKGIGHDTGASPLKDSTKASETDKRIKKENETDASTVSGERDQAFKEIDRGSEHETEVESTVVYSAPTTNRNFAGHDASNVNFTATDEIGKPVETMVRESMTDAEVFAEGSATNETYASSEKKNVEPLILDTQIEEKDAADTVAGSTDLNDAEDRTERGNSTNSQLEIISRLFDTSPGTLKKFMNHGVLGKVFKSEKSKVTTEVVENFDNGTETADHNATESEAVVSEGSGKSLKAMKHNEITSLSSETTDLEVNPEKLERKQLSDRANGATNDGIESEAIVSEASGKSLKTSKRNETTDVTSEMTRDLEADPEESVKKHLMDHVNGATDDGNKSEAVVMEISEKSLETNKRNGTINVNSETRDLEANPEKSEKEQLLDHVNDTAKDVIESGAIVSEASEKSLKTIERNETTSVSSETTDSKANPEKSEKEQSSDHVNGAAEGVESKGMVSETSRRSLQTIKRNETTSVNSETTDLEVNPVKSEKLPQRQNNKNAVNSKAFKNDRPRKPSLNTRHGQRNKNRKLNGSRLVAAIQPTKVGQQGDALERDEHNTVETGYLLNSKTPCTCCGQNSDEELDHEGILRPVRPDKNLIHRPQSEAPCNCGRKGNLLEIRELLNRLLLDI